MRLISFYLQSNPADLRWGIWQSENNTVIDVCNIDASLPSSLRLAVEEGDALYPRLQEVLVKAAEQPQNQHAFSACTLQAPYTNPPRNIMCTGINYMAHLQEFSRPDAEQKAPEFPFLFTKPCTAITHPDAIVSAHEEITQKYDYEVELGVVIGKKGINIREEDALSHIFGYSIINDLSARDLQRRTTQWYAGKSLDQSAPFGPCIVCRQDLANPQDLHLESRINGEVRQSSHTSLMIFTVAKLIHIVSQGTTLLPGDIIATGTPAGVGMSFNPPKFLKSGDVMELEIENIGILRNTIA